MNKSWLGLGGKVAIVTGGASGIGFQMVNELLNNGAKVVVADLHGVEGKQENQSYFIPCDVSNKKMVMDTVDKTVELFGKIDILINNAGINLPRLLVDDRKEKPEYELTEDVDEQSVESFEHNLKDNLYKWWNRMSSGSYFPKPVKAVAIPKKNGGTRTLGIPTVEDRVAQMVAKLYFEPTVEKLFYEDSYGYRPNKSAIQAIEVTRKRCWRKDWVLEFDINKRNKIIIWQTTFNEVRFNCQ